MKDFKDNLDTASIDEKSVDRLASAAPSRTFVQKALQILSRYSLLVIVGLAALSITVLHFQGQHLLQALRGTPLPTFWLEKALSSSVVPDKTEVYQQVLAEEAKEAWQKRSQQVTKPQWQAGYKPKVEQDTTRDSVTVERKAPVVKRNVRKKQRPKKQPVAAAPSPPIVVETPSFFQPVRAASTPSRDRFLACVVHGDQEVENRTRITLRLTEDATVDSQTVPAGTLIYGMTRLGQDRIQVTIARIERQAVQYQVYDHTYHVGILLNGQDRRVQQAGQETAVRQAQRNTYRLPTQIASDIARDLLQQTRRRKQSVLLPDGYPVYISSTNQ